MKFRKDASDSDNSYELPEILRTVLTSLEADSMIILPGDVILFQSQGISSFGLLRENRLSSEELAALIRVVRRTSETYRGSMEIARGPIGEGKREIKVSITPLNDEGMVLVLVSDESEARRIDAVRRDFVANVSHELKTPIGAISLLTEAIMGATDDPVAVLKFAESLQKESQRLANIVQELIQLSRVQAAKLSETSDLLDLNTVIADAVDRNQLLAVQNNIKLATNSDGPVKVSGDYEMLVTAVRNLIENAILYSEPGGQVGIGLRVVENVAEISVTDSGIGIPESEQERIFERFYRVDPSRSRQTGGTGLGLAIVKHAASQHKGEIKLFSKVGVGSTFTLRIPINTSEEK